MAIPEKERPITRRAIMRGLGVAGVGVLGASLLAACGAGTTAATTGTSAATVAATTAAATTAATKAAAATTAAATTSAATTAAAVASTSTATVQGKAPSGKKGEVNWLARTGVIENDWEKKIAVPDFQKANPGVTINLIVAPWDQFDPKLFTLFAAGTPVDVWSHWGRSGFADYVHKGMVADLTPLINAGKYDLSGFGPGLTDIYKQNGKYLGLPLLTTFGMPLFYDKDLLTKAGVDTPPVDWDKPWTRQQWVDAGKKLTANYGAPVATYGITMSNDPQLLARLGGNELYDKDAANTGLVTSTTYDSPETEAAFQMVYDMIYKEKVSPTPQLSSALSAGNLDPFRSQKVAMNQDGGWQFWNYKPQIHNFKWGVAAMPTFKTNTVTTYTDPWMMSSKSVDPDNSWKFVQYLVSPEGQTAYITATGTPPTRTALIDKWLQDFSAPTGMTVADLTTVTSGALKHGVESWNHLLVGYDEISKAHDAALADVWTGKKSVGDGLKAAKAQVEAVIKTIK